MYSESATIVMTNKYYFIIGFPILLSMCFVDRANEATDIIANKSAFTKGIERKEMHKIITKSLSSSRSSVTPILLDRNSL